MTETNLQKELFSSIRASLPPHISLVDTLADLLHISYDSVYRRIRGEKPITLDELKKICEHFQVSLDQLLQFRNDTVVFNAPGVAGGDIEFTDYLKGVLGQMKYFNSFDKRLMYYQCKDAPIFYFYLYPEIGAFKTFCWIKTLLNHPDYADKQFSVAAFPFEECYGIGQQIIKEYSLLPSTELWNFESFNSSINQIEYYRDAGLFNSEADFLAVVESFKKMLNHLQEQAYAGHKYMPGATDTGQRAAFKFYINEVVLGNNSFLLELDEQKLSIITYNTFNYIITRDKRFSNKLQEGFDTLISRSTLVSSTGEKERNRFFRMQRAKIDLLTK